MVASHNAHLEDFHHILRYIKVSPGKGVFYTSHGTLIQDIQIPIWQDIQMMILTCSSSAILNTVLQFDKKKKKKSSLYIVVIGVILKFLCKYHVNTRLVFPNQTPFTDNRSDTPVLVQLKQCGFWMDQHIFSRIKKDAWEPKIHD